MADTADGSKVDDETTTTDDTQDGATATPDEVAKWKAQSRKWEARAKENADAAKRLAEIEDAQKSESERQADRIAAAEKRAAEAEGKALRFEVAAAKKLPPKLMKFLSGSTEEELGASADELLAALEPDTGEGEEPPAGDPHGRPQERLRSGAAEDAEPEDNDPAALAARIPRR